MKYVNTSGKQSAGLCSILYTSFILAISHAGVLLLAYSYKIYSIYPQQTGSWCGFTIVGDNIDKNVRSRHMRLDRQNKSLHYFHSFAVKDRVNLHNVSDTPPTELPAVSEAVEMLLPNEDDHAAICDEFAILVAQMMCDNMQYFKENYGDIVQRHIPHQYEQEMSSKSEVVSTTKFTL
jgi:L1 cell adhesion molecule like protein